MKVLNVRKKTVLLILNILNKLKSSQDLVIYTFSRDAEFLLEETLFSPEISGS